MDKKKLIKMRDRLEELLQDRRLLSSILADPEMRYKLFFVAGALRIKIPLAPLEVQDVSTTVYRTYL